VDDSTLAAVLAAVQADLADLLNWLAQTPDLPLAAAETTTLARLRTVGTRVLEAGLAARGTGTTRDALGCGCGARLHSEGTRPKGVQTVVGWITLNRTYYRCPACGHGQMPLDTALGVGRDSVSPGVRRLACRFGALLPFAQAATTLDEAAGVHLSPSTVRTLTAQLGTQREATMQAQIAQGWAEGWASTPSAPAERCYVAMDGTCILSTDGGGREVKLGMVVPVHTTPDGPRRGPARYAASGAAPDVFGRRLALVAHDQNVEGTDAVAVLGDGAAWIWNLADEHFPGATQIVDWYHASERVWTLGRALHGEGTDVTTTWVDAQLDVLAAGRVADLVAAWQALPCRGLAGAALSRRDGNGAR
jgi:Uncharacterised protein family (UPF0236)